MAEPPAGGNPSTTQALDHDQLQDRTAPDFAKLKENLHAAVQKARDGLKAVGELPSEEEIDQHFLQWLAPKRDQMLRLTDDLAEAYGDIGGGLLAMSKNLQDIDWGIADDLEKVPDYLADVAEPKRGDR
ncbi:hypothetical protein ACQPYK_40215 [Streptosporangium sp. CA-135522]|uniref:hypothetical protein n=1 Tax=Streptosporangium sp. CA-135522 TaxID=3240072 RepID=UPI003D94C369